eukprot:GSMAST32.ASY1.ANO1.598.1 assembled CDS
MPSSLSETSSQGEWWKSLVAGVLAGTVSRCCIAPLDVVKIKLQTSSAKDFSSLPGKFSRYNGIWGTTRSVYKEEGIRGFWRGNVPAVLLYASYSGAQFLALQQIRTKLFDNKEGIGYSFCSGALSGMVATTVTYPLDLLRTQMAAAGNRRQSLVSIISYISRKNGGFRGFYSGLGTAVVQVSPYIGCSFISHQSHQNDQMLNRTTLTVIVGSLSGLFSKIIVYPMDTVKKRMQVRSIHMNSINTPLPGMMTIIRRMIYVEGYKSFY